MSKPVRVRLSPDGTRIAALVQEAPGITSATRIQTFEVSTGKPLTPPLEANGTLTDFVFASNDLLIYNSPYTLVAYNLSKNVVEWQGTVISDSPPEQSGDEKAPPDGRAPQGMPLLENGLPPVPFVNIAISGDYHTVAVMDRDQRNLYLYDTSNPERSPDVPIEPVKLSLPEEGRPTPLPPADFEHPISEPDPPPPRNHLLALDERGNRIAVSFGGSVLVYQLNGDEEPWRIPVGSPDNESDYQYFEGGFCGSYLFFAASTLEDGVRSEYSLYDVDALTSLSEKSLSEATVASSKIRYLHQAPYAPVHAQADKSGIFYSVGGRIYRATLASPTTPRSVGNIVENVAFLYHMPGNGEEHPGRILAGTGSKFLLCGDNEQQGETLSVSGEYQFGCLSSDYLALSSMDNRFLTVLKHEERDTREDISYESGYAHIGSAVSSDGAYVMLYRQSGFQVFFDDKRPSLEKNFDKDKDWIGILEIRYLRSPEDSQDPQAECLKVVYRDRIDYYAPNGDFLTSHDAQVAHEDYLTVFLTKSYRVESSQKDEIQIIDRKGRLLGTLNVGQLLGASQYEDKLLLAFLDGATPRSQLLDRNLNPVAEMTGICEVLPDGTLFSDDRQGHIMRSQLQSLSDLRTSARHLAEEGGNESG